MDGRGRAIDNIFIERLWRTCEIRRGLSEGLRRGGEAVNNLKSYFTFYNHERPHQSLGYQTPAAIYFGKGEMRLRRSKTADAWVDRVGDRRS